VTWEKSLKKDIASKISEFVQIISQESISQITLVNIIFKTIDIYIVSTSLQAITKYIQSNSLLLLL